jgi:phosphoribosylformimino-5-aminoimidazole carboxamide ribotide isomerase
MRAIPAIDLRGGRVVRLLQGRFDAETVYADDPHRVLEDYAALGARLVHVVDLDGARAGTQAHAEIIGELASSGRAGLQVGGGVRDRATVRRLLDAGVQRVVVGSAAVTSPTEVAAWFGEFDVNVDADGTPFLATHGWERPTATSLWDAVDRYLPHGLRHVLCTDVARDGALTGPNVDLYIEAVRRRPGLEWQASGGVRDASDLTALAATGVAAVVTGRAVLEGRIPAGELKPFLPGE